MQTYSFEVTVYKDSDSFKKLQENKNSLFLQRRKLKAKSEHEARRKILEQYWADGFVVKSIDPTGGVLQEV